MDMQRAVTPAQIARIAHEANRALCVSVGDNTQPPWEWAPKWQKESAIKGVLMHLKYPGTTPEQTHEAWMQEKKEAGWSYGSMKNPDKKEHPCMVPFDQLPLEQKIKDVLFAGVVATLAEVAVV